MSEEWVPHREGGVMVDVSFVEGCGGAVHQGSEGHLCHDHAHAQLWWIEWQRSNPRFAVTSVTFRPIAGSGPGAGEAPLAETKERM